MKSVVLWACALPFLAVMMTQETKGQMEVTRTTFHNLEGKKVGTATVEVLTSAVLIYLDLYDLPPGVHGFHIHENGTCEPPFKSAGGHLNPTGKQHGIKNPKGEHLGDLPNLVIPPCGKLETQLQLTRMTVVEGEDGLLDGDGSALIIHAGPDDYTSDPAGNSGQRIACAVVRPLHPY